MKSHVLFNGYTGVFWVVLFVLMTAISFKANAVVGQLAVGAQSDGVLVRFKSGVSNSVRLQVLGWAGCAEVKQFRLVQGLSQASVQSGMNMSRVLSRLQSNSAVLYAEPNYIVTAAAIPNDPRFAELYGLNNTGQTGGAIDADIDAPDAWDVQTGTRVVVGVIDTGLDYNHEDILGNVWVNTGEIANNGIDDDNNGFIDDIRGWDFVNNDNDPFDDNDHGTHVSGTIAALGNNGIGVSGVNWSAQIMALKFLSAQGSGSTADAISALDYAVMMGARITNNSWGGGVFSQALFDSIAAAQTAGHLFVAAAGNDGVNTDVTPSYPASYNLDNIISVAATDDNDALASFSNFGMQTVDLAAPGVSILSTTPANTYSSFSGTSMASPHVAGSAALLLAQDSSLSLIGLKAALLDNVDLVAALGGITLTGGRLNVANSVNDLTRIEVAPQNGILAAGTSLQYLASGGAAPYSWSTTNSVVASINPASGLLTALSAGQTNVIATDANGISGETQLTVTTVVVSPASATLLVADTHQFSALGGTPPYSWASTDPVIASVNSTGLVNGLTLGSVQVSATDSNGFNDTANVIVSDIAISPNTVLLAVGDSQQFRASGGLAPFSWSTGNLSVATIDANGLLTALGAGTTNVTVTDTSGVFISSGDITVRIISVAPLTANVIIGDTQTFSAVGGAAPYRWNVSDTALATVDATTGVLMAIAPGTVQVTATDNDGISGDSGVISVTDNHIIVITPNMATVRRFGSVQFSASGGLAPYRWSLSNPAAGSIDANGLFSAGRFQATTTVIGVDADGHQGETATVSVTGDEGDRMRR